MSNSLQPYGLQPARLMCPWDSPDRNNGVRCCALLQGNPPDSGMKPGSPAPPASAAWFFDHLIRSKKRIYLKRFRRWVKAFCRKHWFHIYIYISLCMCHRSLECISQLIYIKAQLKALTTGAHSNSFPLLFKP